jgi:mono/diheme cytochrome c family protein
LTNPNAGVGATGGRLSAAWWCLALVAAGACSSGRGFEQVLARGEEVYELHCLGCHQASGRGVPRMTPPLVGSEWLSGDPARLVRIVLVGLEEPIEVAGEEYDAVMGAQAYLSDEDVAAVLTYVRERFAAGAPAVRPELVAEVRSQLTPPEEEERR